jgi:hypothetical protein
MAGTPAPAARKSPPPKSPSSTPPPPRGPSDTDFPPQVDMILSAIEAGQFAANANNEASAPAAPARPGQAERRRTKRATYRVRAHLRLFSDQPGDASRVIYTRDVHPRGLGFITPHRLPLGHGGIVELPTPAGKIVSIPCTLLRCREAAPGWFEGSVYFNREQPHLVPGPRKIG